MLSTKTLAGKLINEFGLTWLGDMLESLTAGPAPYTATTLFGEGIIAGDPCYAVALAMPHEGGEAIGVIFISVPLKQELEKQMKNFNLRNN